VRGVSGRLNPGFDPDLNPKVAEFARHYGTVILPTKPYTPRHKGKVESGVKYVKNNALKGRTFSSLAEQREFLVRWERDVADTRIHGTTRKQVRKMFEEVERPALKPLPREPFPFYHEGRRKVHRDGHVEVDRAQTKRARMNQQLKAALKRLKLSGLPSTLEVRLQEAQGNQLSHGEFLELLINDEIAVREDRAIERRVKAARFRELKTIEDFDFGFNPSIKRREIMELATCRFVREQRDVLFTGPPGVGKSHLAQAIGRQAAKMGHVVLYSSIFDTVGELNQAEAFNDLVNFLEFLSHMAICTFTGIALLSCLCRGRQ
jgi:hypothetical protein